MRRTGPRGMAFFFLLLRFFSSNSYGIHTDLVTFYMKAAKDDARRLEWAKKLEAARLKCAQSGEQRMSENYRAVQCKTVRKSIELDPKNSRAHYMLACYAEDITTKEAEWRDAVRCNPNHANAHFNLALLIEHRGKADIAGIDPDGPHDAMAELAYREALLLDPNDARVHRDLGCLLFRRRDLNGAEFEFRASLRCHPDSEAVCEFVRLLLMRRAALQESEREYREALRCNPADAAAFSALCSLQLWRHDFDWAEHELREVLRRDPDDAPAHRNLADVLYKRQDHRKSEAKGDLETEASRKKDIDDAELHWRESLRCDPDHAETHYRLGYLLDRHRNDLDGAELQWREVHRCDPNHASAHYNRIVLSHSLHRRRARGSGEETAGPISPIKNLPHLKPSVSSHVVATAVEEPGCQSGGRRERRPGRTKKGSASYLRGGGAGSLKLRRAPFPGSMLPDLAAAL